jgi:AraC-like DNA-binding protein
MTVHATATESVVQLSDANTALKNRHPGLACWQMHAARQLILDHLELGISVTELARACRLSRSDFTRKFKASTGLSPHGWLRLQRVEKAKALLIGSELPLCEIGVECGFFDQAHFCRVFGKAVGVTPMNWRRLCPGCTHRSEAQRTRLFDSA